MENTRLLRRILWVSIGGFICLIALQIVQAATETGLRARLDQRDAVWKKRLDALELDVASLKRAKLAQDQMNEQEIRMWERLQNAGKSTHAK